MRRFLNWKQGDEEDTWRNKAVETLIKKLKRQPNEQYSALQLVLNKKSEDTPCITLSRSQDGRLQVSHRKMLPHVMYCRIFRWPDLQSQHELRSVPICQYPFGRRESNKICVNPYHYARVDHSLYPPVVTPRSNEFANASPPPQSPLSPGSNYSQSQYQHYQTPPHNSLKQENNNPNDPFHYLNGQQHLHSLPPQAHHVGFAYASIQSPLAEAGYYNGVGSNGEPLAPLAESPRAPQCFESQTPPPRYSGRDQQLAIPMEAADDSQQANATFNTSTEECPEHWCRITYAELNQKIGEPFKGSSQEVFVDGFTNPSVTNRRFSLGVLSNINRNSTIELTRRAIRKGICLENIDNQIFIMNLSESSIFFHSKNCNVENQLNQHTVVKIEPQGRQKIFDQKVFEDLVQEAIRSHDGKTFERLYSLTEHCIIKMSFVKGWGSIYQRQDVTSTPCWIEICLLKPCALIDQYLQRTGPPSAHITSTS